jgi:hypothetical protein
MTYSTKGIEWCITQLWVIKFIFNLMATLRPSSGQVFWVQEKWPISMHSSQYPLSDPLFRFKSTLILRIHRLSSGSLETHRNHSMKRLLKIKIKQNSRKLSTKRKEYGVRKYDISVFQYLRKSINHINIRFAENISFNCIYWFQ